MYRQRQLREPDWRRLPAWRGVAESNWRDVRWQRTHSVRSVRQLHDVFGSALDDVFYLDLERDQERRATMALLVTPQLLNTMVPDGVPTTEAMYADPVRRYLLPVLSDRDAEWPSHPRAARDSLHEAEMWVVEGLTHRYPTKVLADVVVTCPQYCGHCTRMDVVGTATPQFDKRRFGLGQAERLRRMVEYVRASPEVRDVVVSGGDLTNVPWSRLEAFVGALLDIEHVRDIRLASKGLVGLPQHWLSDGVRAGIERMARSAFQRGVALAIHTHVNSAQQVTPLVAEAARAMLGSGVRDVRNQGVLMRGVNGTQDALLDLCFALLDGAGITPYYLYLCDLVPNAEHWRLSLAEAQRLQHEIMGYLPGFATPRLVCDVPYLGKRWVHQVDEYDRELGISYWSKHYRTPLEFDDPEALARRYRYYDPVHTLPESGQAWWRAHAGVAVPAGA